MVTENLQNPNKSRVKGPSGRKLPSRKRAETEDPPPTESSPFDVSFKNKLARCIVQKKPSSEQQPSTPSEQFVEVDLNLVGKMNQAEFNKVWFFRVPSTSCLINEAALSLSHKRGLEIVKTETENNNVVTKIIDTKELEKTDLNDNSSEEASDNSAEEKVKTKKKIWKSCQIL